MRNRLMDWLLWRIIRLLGKRVIGASATPDYWEFRITT